MAVCPVCQAIESSQLILFQDEDVVAYLDENAATMAHITITTRKHYSSITEVPDYLVAWCFAISNKLSKVLLESMSIQGLNLLVEVGEGAGQPYKHFTMNVLPRLQNDNLPLSWQPKKGELNELKEQMEVYKKTTGNKWVFEQKTKPQADQTAEKEVIKGGKENYQIKQLHHLP